MVLYMCTHYVLYVVKVVLLFECGVCFRRLDIILDLSLKPSDILTPVL